MRNGAILILCAALLAGCGGSDTPAPASTAEAGPFDVATVRSTLTNQELMAHVIDYSADGVWLRQGWVMGETVEELFPTDERGWFETESAALTLAEASNLLLLPGRNPDDSQAWIDYTHALHDAAMAAAKAAETAAADPSPENKQAFFDRGGDIYVVCRDCHSRYVIGTVQ
jgi:hypothetical protein